MNRSSFASAFAKATVDEYAMEDKESRDRENRCVRCIRCDRCVKQENVNRKSVIASLEETLRSLYSLRTLRETRKRESLVGNRKFVRTVA